MLKLKAIGLIFGLFIFGYCQVHIPQDFKEKVRISQEFKEKAGNFMTACIAENNPDQHLLVQMTMTDKYIHHPSIDCFAKCMVKKFDWINDEGILNPDLIKETLFNAVEGVDTFSSTIQETVKSVIEECKASAENAGPDQCKIAGKLAECFYNAKSRIINSS